MYRTIYNSVQIQLGAPCTAGAIAEHVTAARRFPAPWKAEKMPGGYVVRGRQRAGACARLLQGHDGRGQGAYVIGTYGDEQEETVKTIDSGVKTAVFHAMPK